MAHIVGVVGAKIQPDQFVLVVEGAVNQHDVSLFQQGAGGATLEVISIPIKS